MKIKKIVHPFSFALLWLITFPHLVSAQSFNVLKDLQDIGHAAGYNTTTATDFKVVLANLVRLVIGFIGIIFVILIIWGGIEWMTSGGNEQKIENAKNRIKNATIGLVVVVMAYSIAYTITKWLAQAVG